MPDVEQPRGDRLRRRARAAWRRNAVRNADRALERDAAAADEAPVLELGDERRHEKRTAVTIHALLVVRAVAIAHTISSAPDAWPISRNASGTRAVCHCRTGFRLA